MAKPNERCAAPVSYFQPVSEDGNGGYHQVSPCEEPVYREPINLHISEADLNEYGASLVRAGIAPDPHDEQVRREYYAMMKARAQQVREYRPHSHCRDHLLGHLVEEAAELRDDGLVECPSCRRILTAFPWFFRLSGARIRCVLCSYRPARGLAARTRANRFLEVVDLMRWYGYPVTYNQEVTVRNFISFSEKSRHKSFPRWLIRAYNNTCPCCGQGSLEMREQWVIKQRGEFTAACYSCHRLGRRFDYRFGNSEVGAALPWGILLDDGWSWSHDKRDLSIRLEQRAARDAEEWSLYEARQGARRRYREGGSEESGK